MALPPGSEASSGGRSDVSKVLALFLREHVSPVWMTLLSVINSLEPREYMEALDYWTEYSIESHFRQLVIECQMINATGKTETEETGNSDNSDDLPPFTEIYHEQNEI